MLDEDTAFVRAVKAEQWGANHSGARWDAPVPTIGIVVPAIVDHSNGFGCFRCQYLLESGLVIVLLAQALQAVDTYMRRGRVLLPTTSLIHCCAKPASTATAGEPVDWWFEPHVHIVHTVAGAATCMKDIENDNAYNSEYCSVPLRWHHGCCELIRAAAIEYYGARWSQRHSAAALHGLCVEVFEYYLNT